MRKLTREQLFNERVFAFMGAKTGDCLLIDSQSKHILPRVIRWAQENKNTDEDNGDVHRLHHAACIDKENGAMRISEEKALFPSIGYSNIDFKDFSKRYMIRTPAVPLSQKEMYEVHRLCQLHNRTGVYNFVSCFYQQFKRFVGIKLTGEDKYPKLPTDHIAWFNECAELYGEYLYTATSGKMFSDKNYLAPVDLAMTTELNTTYNELDIILID